MTQIINLLSFLKELIFNRGKKDGKKDQKSGLLQTIVIAALAISLYGNYILVGRVYEKTKQLVSLKNEVHELRPLSGKVAELQYINNTLSHTIALLTGGVSASENKRRPSRPPPAPPPNNETATVPSQPPTSPTRRPPVKEATVE